VHFLLIYGGAWAILAGRLSGRGVFERAAVTIIVAHMTAYMTFIFHFLTGFAFKPTTSLIVYMGLLYLFRLLFKDLESQWTLVEGLGVEQKKEIGIWSA